MENRTMTLSLAGLAVVAVATSTAGPSPARPEARTPPAVTDSTRSAPPGPGRDRHAEPHDYAPHSGDELLHDFFGTHWGRDSSAAPETFDLHILIATAPDPFDSHLDWSFDAQLQAIRRAYESSGYLMDRFWFPAAGDTLERKGVPGSVATREIQPGVMLLRHANGPSLQLLYVVPELPTRGIYKAAMRTALDERYELLRHHDLPLRTDTLGPIRIIGPTFSGSALSLQLAIRGWIATQDSLKRHREAIEIVSGSATNMANVATLNCPALRMRFRATIHPDQSLDQLLVDSVLPRLELDDSNVALLRESSTQYGQGLLASDTTVSRSHGACGPWMVASESSSTAPPARRRPQPGFVVIPLPMSISSLRSEYQRVPSASGDQPVLPGASDAPRLPLDLLDPSRPKEDLPVTSRLSPVAIDLILDEIARTLTRRQIRLVGLLATDVRDKLFLGDEIRKRVRNIQFFTYESNVLYLRSDRLQALGGMLVFSTYPLILDNQWSSSIGPARSRRSPPPGSGAPGPRQVRAAAGAPGDRGAPPGTDTAYTPADAEPAPELFAFGSDGAEGVYNATLLQLGQTGAMLDYRYGPDRPSGTGKPVARPPVWITTVGNRVFLPVFRYDSADASYVASGCDSCLVHHHWTQGLPFLSLGAMIIAGIALLIFAWQSWMADRQLSSSLESLEGTVETQHPVLRDLVMRGSLMLHDRLYDLLRVVAVFGIFVAACAPVVRLVRQLSRFGVPSPLYVLLLGVVLVAGGLGLAALGRGAGSIVRLSRHVALPAWTYFWQGPWSDSLEKWTWRLEVLARTVVVLFGLAYLAVSLGFAAEIWDLDGSRFWIFYRRAMEMDSLVSPLLPLMLGGIGYAIWCSWHVERIKLLKLRTTFESVCDAELDTSDSPRVTISSALRDDLLRTAKVARTIRNRLFQVIPSLGAIGVLLAFGCLVVWLWPRFGRSLEALLSARSQDRLPFFDVLFRGMVLASMFATAWGAYRLAAVWDGLRQCLAGFSRMPIVTAFDRLPARLARLTRLTLPGFTPIASTGAVADLQWLHLQQIYSTQKNEFSAALLPYNPDLLHRMDELMGTPAVQALSLDRSGRRALVGRFVRLHHILRELWRMEPMPADVDALVVALGKEFERGDTTSAASTTLRVRRGFAGPVRVWVRAAEEYAASRMVEYIEWVIRHLRILSLFMLLSLLLTTMLVSSYPYQPQSLLRLILLLVLAGTVGSFITVLVQMNRDEVLSRIARTEPGRLTWNGTFIVNLVTFGLVPLLTLLSSEFPGLRNALFAWVQPLVNALAKQ